MLPVPKLSGVGPSKVTLVSMDSEIVADKGTSERYENCVENYVRNLVHLGAHPTSRTFWADQGPQLNHHSARLQGVEDAQTGTSHGSYAKVALVSLNFNQHHLERELNIAGALAKIYGTYIPCIYI